MRMSLNVLYLLHRTVQLFVLVMPSMGLAQGPECPWTSSSTPITPPAPVTNLNTWPASGGFFTTFTGPTYRDFNVFAGRVYEWSMCTEDGGLYSGDIMSIMDPVTHAPLPHWDIPSPCGEPRLRYLAPTNGMVRIFVNDPTCSGITGSGTVRWRCVTCGAGCTNAPGGEYPAGVFTPTCTGRPQVITDYATNGSYSSVQLTAGTPYTVSAMPLPALYPGTTMWITVTDATGTTILHQSANVRTFTPTATGTYRIYTHHTMVDMGCDAFEGDLRAISCGTYDPCATLPIACETEQMIYLQGAGSWTSTACGTSAGTERILTYTPSISGTYRLDATGGLSLNPGIRYAWKPASLGCDANNWTCLGTITNPVGQMYFNLTAGVPIYILVQAVTADPIWQKIALRCAIPQNQSCATAVPVNSYPATLTADARWTTATAASSCNGSLNQTLWYKATGTCGTMTANSCGSGRNTALAVYVGSCGSLTELTCNDNATAGPCAGTQQSYVSWTAQQGVDYYIAISQQPLNIAGTLVLNISATDADGDGVGDACDVQLSVRAMLDGPYDNTTGLMNDGMRSLGVLQLIEPYTNMNYPHVNGGGESTTVPVVSVGGNNAIVDWVLLELRSAATPSVVLDTRSALIQRDGDIVDVDGVSPVNMRSAAGNYHVAVRHRNHLGVMTASPVTLTASGPLVDFTTPAMGTYGTQAQKTSSGAFSKQVMWSGDVGFDHVIKYTGANNDRDPILVNIGGTTPNNTVTSYGPNDVNLDGQVKYTGSANDRDPILVNIGGNTPNNTRLEQLP